MKNIILCLLLITAISKEALAQIPDVVTPLLKNITRAVIWGSDGYGENNNNILRFGAGISITPTPSSVTDTSNILGDTIQLESKLYASKLSAFKDSVKIGSHKFRRRYKRLNVNDSAKKVILTRIANRKKLIEDHCAISLGYENIKTKVKIDSSSSYPDIYGFYVGGFYSFSSMKIIPLTIGCTLGLFSISHGTATIGPESNPFPIQFSSSSIISPEVYIGTSIIKGLLFIELSYKYLDFNTITYAAANYGAISNSKYIQLPAQVDLSSFHLTIGLSIPLNFNDFSKR